MEDAATAAATAMSKTLKAGAGGVDDLSAYHLDDYDEEESTGAGKFQSHRYILSRS